MHRLARLTASLALALGLAGCADFEPGTVQNTFLPTNRTAVTAPQPVSMRWGAKAGSDAWTAATMAALEQHGDGIVARVPRDIAAFCPGYEGQDAQGRRAFWAGLMSSVAKHESTWNPRASGGGGRWLGLMQIAPATWRHYGCSGEIMNGADNMACAVKIAARQVGRDNAVASADGGWRGVARDWAPMRSPKKRADIAAWTAAQPYCSVRG